MKKKIIICGLNAAGQKIFKLLKHQNTNVIGINELPISGLDRDIIIGELCSEKTLIEAGIREADTLVITNNDDGLNLAILAIARSLNPQIRIINRLFNQTLGKRLDNTLSGHLSMSVSAISAPLFAFASLGNTAIGQLSLFEDIWPVTEEIITENHPLLGKQLTQLWHDPTTMLMYYFTSEGKSNFLEALLNNETLKIGDRLILAHCPSAVNLNRDYFKKMFRGIINLKKYQPHIAPVILVNFILLAIIFIATLTYLCFNLNTSAIDALYFSIGMITGAGGQEQVAEQASTGVKIFTAMMMIVGTGVIGIFYALTNDFILGSRFKQFWDATRIPHDNHYIICGLGIIGLQIARQLHARGHEVLIIEPNHNNRFLKTVRGMGIPIILDDATFAEALNAANIQRAKSLIAVTRLDMANVDIALTAKQLAPNLRVVLRVQNTKIVESIQQVFCFDRVLCPLDLGSPSFAAAALGDKVLGNGLIQNFLWIALDITITADHPFCDTLVKSTAKKIDFTPLYLQRSHQIIVAEDLLETQINSGDILSITIDAAHLDRLSSQSLAVADRTQTKEYNFKLLETINLLEKIGQAQHPSHSTGDNPQGSLKSDFHYKDQKV